MTVDQIELPGVFERFGDVKVFRHLGINRPILFVALVDHGVQSRPRNGILGREQRDVPAAGRESFGDVAGYRLPGSILPGRGSPRHRRENRNAFVVGGHSEFMAPNTSASGTVAKPVAWSARPDGMISS